VVIEVLRACRGPLTTVVVLFLAGGDDELRAVVQLAAGLGASRFVCARSRSRKRLGLGDLGDRNVSLTGFASSAG